MPSSVPGPLLEVDGSCLLLPRLAFYNADMRRLLTRLDDPLEGRATFVYGPLPADEERPSLWAKFGVLLHFTALIVLGVAAGLR